MRSDHISEFSGLSDNASMSLLKLAQSYYAEKQRTPFVLFTDPVQNKRGIALKAYIEKSGVGKVWESEQRENPNSHRQLVIYTFAPDDEALKAWYEPRWIAHEDARELNREQIRSRLSYIPFSFDPDAWKPEGTEDTFMEKAKKIIKSVVTN